MSGAFINAAASGNINIETTTSGDITIDANSTGGTGNRILIEAAEDIYLRHGSNGADKIVIQPLASTPVLVDIRPASGANTSTIDLYHDSAGGNTNLMLRSNNSTNSGEIAVSTGMTLVLDAPDVGNLAFTDDPTLDADGSIHYDFTGQKVLTPNESIFASGNISASYTNFSSYNLVWTRVGNVITGSGNGTVIVSPSGAIDLLLPVRGTGGVAYVNGIWVKSRAGDFTTLKAGQVELTGGNEFNFLPVSNTGTDESEGIGGGDSIRFTFSYRIT